MAKLKMAKLMPPSATRRISPRRQPREERLLLVALAVVALPPDAGRDGLDRHPQQEGLVAQPARAGQGVVVEPSRRLSPRHVGHRLGAQAEAPAEPAPGVYKKARTSWVSVTRSTTARIT